MESHLEEYVQLDFLGLLPGAAGGRALRDKLGRAHFRELALKAAARPPEDRLLAQRAGQEKRRRRLHTMPRTRIQQELDEVVVERIIPYWPANSRPRKRPIYVRIEISRRRIEEQKSLYVIARTTGQLRPYAPLIYQCKDKRWPANSRA